jgi:hypothetical protein
MAPTDDPPGTEEATAEDRARFRRTLIRVMTVQVLALAGLWLLQSRYWR